MFKKTIFLVIKVNKKIVIAAIAVLIILLLFPFLLKSTSRSVFNSQSKNTVVIDPGHGGVDGGSSDKQGLLEKNINLEVGLKLRSTLKDMNINAILTRDSDISLESKSTIKASRYGRDLNARKTIIDNANAEAFVSIHVDAYRVTSARGVKIFYNSKSEEGKRLADVVCAKINKIVFEDFLNTTEAKAEAKTGDYYVLRESKAPGIIVEIGFITNPEDNKLIQSKDYQGIISKAIAEGMVQFLQK